MENKNTNTNRKGANKEPFNLKKLSPVRNFINLKSALTTIYNTNYYTFLTLILFSLIIFIMGSSIVIFIGGVIYLIVYFISAIAH